MALRIEVDQQRLAEFCRRHRVKTLSFFGSVLREDFHPGSDVDVLVEPEPGISWALGELLDMEDELAGLLGRSIDLVERQAVQRSPNYIRRDEVLSTAEVAYASR